MPHLDDGVLHAMVDGEIPSAELVAVQAHLARCDSCRARLAEAQAFAAEARVLVEQVEPPEAGRQGGRTAGRQDGRAAGRRLAWAASVVLAVGLGYGVGAGGRGTEPPAPNEAVSKAPLAVVPPPATLAANQEPAPRADAAAATAPGAAKVAGPSTELREAKSEAAPRSEEPVSVASAPAPIPSAPAVATAAPAAIAANEVSGRVAGERMAQRRQVLDEADGYTETSLAEAVALLGGRLRLIDGLVPERLERSGLSVRVTYPGPVYLVQHRQGDSVAVRLIAPGVAADSVARLLTKVR